MRLIIISGRSGSGKTICLNLLEDMGFYCVNNLPLNFLPQLPQELTGYHTQVAVSVDVRNLRGKSQHYHAIIAQLDKQQIQHETLFFDTDDSKLLKRYSETRRKHPLSDEKTSLQEAIASEQQLLEPIQRLADLVIDTSELSIYQLRDLLRDRVTKRRQTLSLLFQSFAFKRGVPRDSDFVFDVRSLPNPYWKPDLREYTGKDANVSDWLAQQPSVQAMLDDLTQFLTSRINENKQQDRNYLTLSIGCTGGQHRSVFMVEQLAKHFSRIEEHVQLRHVELL